MHKRANNEWKKNYFVFKKFPVGACSTLRSNAADMFSKLFKPKSMTGRCSVTKVGVNTLRRNDAPLSILRNS